MSKRSPVLGYNHNFRHRGLVFHVQTEDSGVDNPHLFTHVFHGGVIVSSRKSNYDASFDERDVKKLMKSQHRAMVRGLKDGEFDDKIDSYLGSNEELLPRKSRADTEDSLEFIPELEVELEVIAEPEPSPPPTPPSVPAPSVPAPIIPTAIELEAPLERSTKHRHERNPIPTPIAVPIVSTKELGDPIVTFSDSAAPAAPVEAAPERSAPYSITRPAKSQRAHTQARRANTQPPARRRPTTRPPQRGTAQPRPPERSMGVRASGKAANTQPGARRSSVVVSRPAVIIGAPARAVGSDSARRTRRRTGAPRKTPNTDLFGNDTISEKSLDEVIMAYLSEDNDNDE